MNWFTRIFHNTAPPETIAPMKKFLIVGLGNIGVEYVNTRHNIGFKILDFMAKKEALSFETVKLGALAEYKFKGRTYLLLKPNTYMNLSGKAVQYWMEKEKIAKENLLVIADDLNLIRFKQRSIGAIITSPSVILDDSYSAACRIAVAVEYNFNSSSWIMGEFQIPEYEGTGFFLNLMCQVDFGKTKKVIQAHF